jgi:hypothetical protein
MDVLFYTVYDERRGLFLEDINDFIFKDMGGHLYVLGKLRIDGKIYSLTEKEINIAQNIGLKIPNISPLSIK